MQSKGKEMMDRLKRRVQTALRLLLIPVMMSSTLALPAQAQQAIAALPPALPPPPDSAQNVAARGIGAMTRSADTGLMFELHGRYYQINGPINIFSTNRQFDAARLRLYDLFKAEWSGYQGVLRTNLYASNDGLAHLVAGKKVELLTDRQVSMLVARHLPEEASRLIPEPMLSSLPPQAAAVRSGIPAAAEAAGMGLYDVLGLSGIILVGGLVIWTVLGLPLHWLNNN
jgi:hypothetical protein